MKTPKIFTLIFSDGIPHDANTFISGLIGELDDAKNSAEIHQSENKHLASQLEHYKKQFAKAQEEAKSSSKSYFDLKHEYLALKKTNIDIMKNLEAEKSSWEEERSRLLENFKTSQKTTPKA